MINPPASWFSSVSDIGGSCRIYFWNNILIFSFSGREQYTNQVRIALKTDYPISVVFYDELPKTFLGRDVIDGNKSDLNNVLEFNKIIGLSFKEIKDENFNEFKDNGFIVYNHQLDFYNKKFLN